MLVDEEKMFDSERTKSARSRTVRWGLTTAVSVVLLSTHANDASADALRLRGDALGQTRSPVGLLVLRGEDRTRPWMDVEAVAWLGTGYPIDVGANAPGNVQTLTVRVFDPKGLGEVRVGRFVFSTGAIRPVHVDGFRALGRARFGGVVELFGGAPVAPRMGSRMYDTAFGGRVSQTVGTYLVIGASYLMRRKDGRISDQEVGPDLALSPARWLDVAGRLAYDIGNNPGVADALASVGAHSKSVRVEGFVTHRSAGRLLPSTSLFSVLGDFAATTTGGTFRWRAAPRLDLLATGAAVTTVESYGSYGTARATLALDDEWAGSLGLEVRRQQVGDAKWSGARAIGSFPLGSALRAGLEFELVRPDDQKGKSFRVWPWALAALAYRTRIGWDFGGAVEFVGTRDDRTELHALLRATWAYESLR